MHDPLQKNSSVVSNDHAYYCNRIYKKNVAVSRNACGKDKKRRAVFLTSGSDSFSPIYPGTISAQTVPTLPWIRPFCASRELDGISDRNPPRNTGRPSLLMAKKFLSM